MQSLFAAIPTDEHEPTPAVERPVGPFAAVAIERSVDKELDYSIPPRLRELVQVGQRVRVPLGRGNRATYGYIVALRDRSNYPKLKPLLAIADERVLVPPKLMELGRWISRYYCAPLGTVIETIIPSAVKRRVGLGYTQKARLAGTREDAQTALEKTKARKRRAILARLLQLEPGESIDLIRLASEAGATVPTVRKLVRLGLIAITSEADLPGLTEALPAGPGNEPEIALNDDQRKAFDALHSRLGNGFSVNLLLGVTGSGKTEVYLQCIRDVVAAGRQAIVLVPEIALTPQTVRRFTARFQRVAVLHSGLTASERHRFWQQVSTGQAQVVVGARSAVFAPTPNLGLIVVDEEHEASYKQDNAPRYHARDVAIKRAQIENVPIVLGSATPSIETFWRVAKDRLSADQPYTAVCGIDEPKLTDTDPTVAGHRPIAMASAEAIDALVRRPPIEPTNYHLEVLPRRVRGLSMPAVELIDMATERRLRRGVHLLSRRLEFLLRTTLEAGNQAILLLNRRGYSNFVHCPSCSHVVQCKYCDATMTYHRSASTDVKSGAFEKGVHTGQLHCHYCLAVNPLPDKCPDCGKLMSLFGLGTQRVEEEITKKFPDLKFARVDSDTMRSSKDYEALLGKFARREIQVMLGTQMIAKGLDYPNVTLVGVISGDTALSLPDFRAAERTFQLITQVAGRAGRGDAAGRVILQTFLPDDPTIQAAIRQDYVGYARTELANRRDVGLPPFARMVRIILRDQDSTKLNQWGEDLTALLAEAVAAEPPESGIRMKGPMPCPISRIAGYFRNQIVLLCNTAAPLQRVLAAVRAKGGLAKNERIAVDVDPVSLL